MARWIVFDERTAADLRLHVAKEAVFEAPGRTAIEYALTAPRTVVAVLGGQDSNQATIAVFRPSRPFVLRPQGPATVVSTPMVSPPPVALPAVSATTRASGFLGLSDQWVEPEEEAAVKKSWWQFWR
jgi:hypothetical protein